MIPDPPAEWAEGYDTCFAEMSQSAEFVRFVVIDELMDERCKLQHENERLRSALWCAAALAGAFFLIAVAVVVKGL